MSAKPNRGERGAAFHPKPSEPNVPVRAEIITYHWDGRTLDGLLHLVKASGDLGHHLPRPAPEVFVNLTSWITADQAVDVLKKIIWQIEHNGLPCPDQKVSPQVAEKLELEGDDE